MRTDKKDQPSSGSKGAKLKTDPTTEIIFTDEQKEKISYLSETLDGKVEKYLMKFPEQTVMVCERRDRQLAKLIQEMDEFVGEYKPAEMEQLLLSLLKSIHQQYWDDERRCSHIPDRIFSFWTDLYSVTLHMAHSEYELAASLDMEYVPVVCLQ